MTPSHSFYGLCCALLLTACATPAYRTVDAMFPAARVERAALNRTAEDITGHSDGSVIILVKYILREPFADTLRLAKSQGKAVRDYLREQGVKAPIQIVTSPTNVSETEIWVSYQVRTKTDEKKEAPSAPLKKQFPAPKPDSPASGRSAKAELLSI